MTESFWPLWTSFFHVLKRASLTGEKWWVSTNGHSWLGSDNAIPGGVGSWALDPFGPGERGTLGRGLVNRSLFSLTVDLLCSCKERMKDRIQRSWKIKSFFLFLFLPLSLQLSKGSSSFALRLVFQYRAPFSLPRLHLRNTPKGNLALLPSIWTLRHADSPFVIRRGIRPRGISIGTSPSDFARRRSRHLGYGQRCRSIALSRQLHRGSDVVYIYLDFPTFIRPDPHMNLEVLREFFEPVKRSRG